MKLVIDTSIVFSLFTAVSFTNKLLKEYNLKLFSPKELIGELHKYSGVICSKSGISKETFLEDISLLPELIELKNATVYYENKARLLIEHESDIPFLALALEMGIPIWSNDNHFKKQNLVKIFTTEELKRFLDSL